MGGQEQWPTTAEAVFTGMADWRVAHPRTTLREIEEAVLAVWFIRRCHAPAERAIPDLMISSGVIRHQRPPRTGSLDDPAPHARISIQEHAYLCIIYVWRYKDYSACEVA